MKPVTGAGFTMRLLDESTWPAFERLVEANGGIWGGCWCISFHLDPKGPKGQCKPSRETKERFVGEGRAQAAMVFEGEEAVGWCQFGITDELQNIKHRKQYEEGLGEPPDWRITCFFVGKGYRKRGVANLALTAALDEMARLGGGVVEAYPEDVEGRQDLVVVSAWRDAGHVRARRVQPSAAAGDAPLGGGEGHDTTGGRMIELGLAGRPPTCPKRWKRHRISGPRFVRAGEGIKTGFGKEQTTPKLSPEEAGGQFSVDHVETEPGGGPPLHVHSLEDELWVILDGEFEFRVGGDTH